MKTSGADELGDCYLRDSDSDRVEAPGRWASGAQLMGVDPQTPVSAQASSFPR
ncbi:MAG: hypothetical protein ACRDNS_34845 [Trebonia sp.]